MIDCVEGARGTACTRLFGGLVSADLFLQRDAGLG